MQAYIIDIVIILVLAFYVWRGAKKGLILTLFSLLAIFVAFFGAKAMATNFAKPVANIIRPSIQLTIEGVITGRAVYEGTLDVAEGVALCASLTAVRP